MEILLLLLAAILISGSKIIPIDEADLTPPGETTFVWKKQCMVEVSKSKELAISQGEIVEKCVIKPGPFTLIPSEPKLIPMPVSSTWLRRIMMF
jgi:hypothetical protein